MSQTNTLPGTNTHFINLATAIEMTALFRAENENILAPAYQNQNILPLSETFNRHAFDTLLAEEGCEGLRIYMGMDAGMKIHAIIVGVNQYNEDILPSLAANLVATSGNVIAEEGQRCPVICPQVSVLNS
jgi:hypothetical protein